MKNTVTINQFASNNIYYNISEHVYECNDRCCFSDEPSFMYRGTLDYKTLVNDVISTMTEEDLSSLIEHYKIGKIDKTGPTIDACGHVFHEIDQNVFISEFCGNNTDIDPDDYYREIFEHWLISDWLATQLEAKNEKVFRLHNLIIYGRATTGQPPSNDKVIEAIYAESLA